MPLGSGYTVEGQVTGKEEFGGIQIIVYEAKKIEIEQIKPRINRSKNQIKQSKISLNQSYKPMSVPNYLKTSLSIPQQQLQQQQLQQPQRLQNIKRPSKQQMLKLTQNSVSSVNSVSSLNSSLYDHKGRKVYLKTDKYVTKKKKWKNLNLK